MVNWFTYDKQISNSKVYESSIEYNVYFKLPRHNFISGALVCTEANMDASKKDLSEEPQVELEVSFRPNQSTIVIILNINDFGLL